MLYLLGDILTESQPLQLWRTATFRRIGKSIPEKVYHVAPFSSDNLVHLTQTQVQTIALASGPRTSLVLPK